LLLGAAVAAGAGDDTLIPVPAARSVAENLRASLPTPVYDPAADLGLTEDVIQDLLVAIPMRDGAELAATILRPRSPPAARLPVILIRTPYRHGDEIGGGVARQMLPKLLRSGYAVVVVSDRGTQWSSGSYRYLHGQNRDGAQILDWIAAQPWSNGRIGTVGSSYAAITQVRTAIEAPPHLTAIWPDVVPTNSFQNQCREGGAMQQHMFWALFIHAQDDQRVRGDPVKSAEVWDNLRNLRQMFRATPWKAGQTALRHTPELEASLLELDHQLCIFADV
jgi:putative CocE/NonD family hydrolase